MLNSGTVLKDRYRILRQIGRGGMSRVYLVEDISTGAMKAIKESIRLSGETGTAHLQKLSHPGLLKVEGVAREGERAFILMEYVAGKSLQEILTKYGAQPYDSLLNWMLQLCEILSYLHTRIPPIIYRDLKPSNIILQPDGELKLIDFGAAREYSTGETEDTVLLGTRGYAAPEQYGGYGQTDIRTDIYGLGATIYHLATDRDPSKPPYMRYPITQFARDIPHGFSEILRKCTNLLPDKRYASCEHLKSDLLKLKGIQFSEETSPEHKHRSHRENCKYVIETDITIVYTSEML